jgi:hypothetical protein
MAEEQDNYKINFDTNAKKAAQDTNELAQGLDNVNDSTQKVVNSNKSLKAQMKEATIELIQAQQKFGDYSKEALSAAKNLAQLRDKIAEASETANLFDPGKKFQAVAGAVSAMASGFAVAQGAMGLFGAESEEVEKTLLKVQSAMALSQGLSTIADSAKDFQRLKAIVVDAMKSIATAKAIDTVATESNTVAQGANAAAVTADTAVKGGATIATTALTVATNILNASMAILTAPIFLVIAAIAGLVAGIGYLTGAFGDFSGEAAQAEKANKKLSSEIDSLAKSSEKSNKEMERSNNYLLGMSKASGASSSSLRKLAEQLINNEVAEKRLNATKAQSIFLEARRVASLEDATDAQKATAQKAYELFKEQNGIYNDSLDKRKELALNHRIQIRQEEKDADNKLADDRKKANEKRLEAQKEANKKALEEAKKQKEKEAALVKEGLDYENNLRKQLEDLGDDTEEEKLNRMRSRAEIEIEALKQKGINVEEITRLNAEKFDELEAELAEKRNEEDIDRQAKKGLEEIEIASSNADRQIEIDKALEEAKKQVRQTGVDNVSNIGQQMQVLAGKNKAVAKAGLIVEGAVGIANIVSSTMQANAKAVAASPLTGGMPFVAINSISGALSAASQVKAIATGLKALGSGGAPTAPSIGGGGTAVSATAPTVAFNNTAENQIGQSVARTQAEQPPAQVVVLESDITTAQGRVAQLIENNTI